MLPEEEKYGKIDKGIFRGINNTLQGRGG